MSDSQPSEIQKLLRLKRHEQPPEGYYEDFLLEFQHRQRAEMLRRSSFSLWTEKVANWFYGLGGSKWVWGGATAYAAVMIFAFMRPDTEESFGAGDEATLPGASMIETSPVQRPGIAGNSGAGGGSGKSGSMNPKSRSDSGGNEPVQPVSAPGFREL